MMRQFQLTSAAILVLLLGNTVGSAVEVVLRPSVVVSTAVVRLSDVADVAAGEEERGQQLLSLPLMPAPALGTQRFLRKREVEYLLSAHGIKLGDLRISGADVVAIAAPEDEWTRSAPLAAAETTPLNRHAALLAGQMVAKDHLIGAARAQQLHATINQTIIAYLKTKSELAAEWRVMCELPERQLALLDAATSSLSCQGAAAPWIGRQQFLISFTTRDGAVQLPIYAQVAAVSTPVVVAVRSIPRRSIITAADLELRSVSYIPKVTETRSAVDSLDTLIGMEARLAIQAGDVVYSDQVQAPIVIKRGEVVSVSSHAGGIRVRTTARARQDGARGELVQLESLDTRERFDARVTGPREAAVFAPVRIAKSTPIRAETSLTKSREDAKR
jgi:flagellar basal body P-ring formation protein FlgA